MLRLFGGKNAPDKTIVALPHVTKSEMLRGMARARYCPIFGGNSPWSTRLVEAMMARCVPVFFSSWLPPFSRVLDWSRFSVRWPYARASSLVPFLRTLPEERVCAMRRAAVEAWEAHFSTTERQVDTLLRVLAMQCASP